MEYFFCNSTQLIYFLIKSVPSVTTFNRNNNKKGILQYIEKAFPKNEIRFHIYFVHHIFLNQK